MSIFLVPFFTYRIRKLSVIRLIVTVIINAIPINAPIFAISKEINIKRKKKSFIRQIRANKILDVHVKSIETLASQLLD